MVRVRVSLERKDYRKTDMEMQMKLKILLPFQILIEKAGVLRVVAETHGGSFGLLPHRLDCVAALAPGRNRRG